MKKSILAKKVGMTQIFNEDGVLTPVTVLQAGPCVVTQVKTADKDGYDAVQVGFEDIREKLVTKGEWESSTRQAFPRRDSSESLSLRTLPSMLRDRKLRLTSLLQAITSTLQQFQRARAIRVRSSAMVSTEAL